jgi:hypothetical protein
MQCLIPELFGSSSSPCKGHHQEQQQQQGGGGEGGGQGFVTAALARFNSPTKGRGPGRG